MEVQFYFRDAQLHSGVPGTLIHTSPIGCPDHLCSPYFTNLCLVSQKRKVWDIKRKPLFLSGICFIKNWELLSCSAETQGQGCKTSWSCSMIALNIHHKQLILAFPSVFKVFPQTEARSLHGNAALGLNSCSVIMWVLSCIYKNVNKGDMSLCCRPRTVS